MFLLWLRQLPQSGDQTSASIPPPSEGRANPTNTPVFPPSSSTLLSFVWVYIFFSSGQVLLSILSWCSACTSVSEGIFLMHPWREMYSTSTYSSTILFLFYNMTFWKCLFYNQRMKSLILTNLYSCNYNNLEKEMATHSSVLAWRIPGMGEPGWLPSLGSHRVGHDWSDLAPA